VPASCRPAPARHDDLNRPTERVRVTAPPVPHPSARSSSARPSRPASRCAASASSSRVVRGRGTSGDEGHRRVTAVRG
jgi:hypothetical protein